MALYGRDLAFVHDDGFGDFARLAAPGLLRLLAAAGIREGLVTDLGCGSGIWARALNDRGFDVLGVDVSGAMLEIARRRAPRSRFVRGSAFDVALPPCAAVTSIGECLGYGDFDLPPLFRRVRRALPAGGIFVFDLATPGRERTVPRRTWHEGRGWCVLLEASEAPDHRVLERKVTVFRRREAAWRRSAEVHRVTLHEPDAVLRALDDAGFDARLLRGYGRALRFRRGHAGFLATRR